MQQQPGGTFRLIVRRGPQPNHIHEMGKDIITIGRDITNDITINDPEVSRHHARLTRGGGGYTIEDLGSTNGTFVNGQRLTGARPLSPGDMIGLGETVTLAYEMLGMAAGPSAMATVAGSPPPQAPADNPYAPPSPYGQPAAPQAPAYGAPPPQQQPPAYGMPPQSPYQQQPPSPYAPQPGGSPYAQPASPYGQPAYPDQPSAPYGGMDYAPEPQRGGMGRWLLLGCGCFIVLCIIGSILTGIIVDSTCAWKDEPLSSLIDMFGFEADLSAPNCQ